MPKLARPTKGKKSLKGGKLRPLNMRTTAEVRDRLERAAAASGRSMAQEVEFRLQRSLDREDPWTRPFILSMTAAFLHAGRQQAMLSGRPELTESGRWVRDPDCYREAVSAVSYALYRDCLDTDIETRRYLVDSVLSRLLSAHENAKAAADAAPSQVGPRSAGEEG